MSTQTPASVALKPSLGTQLWQHHRRDLTHSLRRLSRSWVSTVLTCLAIGVTLALPTTLHSMVRNVSTVAFAWESSGDAAVFLQDGVSEVDGGRVAAKMAQLPGVAAARYISPTQALTEFKRLSGFNEVIAVLDENPLPGMVAVTPRADLLTATLDQLVKTLRSQSMVSDVSLDSAWLSRLKALLSLVERLVWMLATVLAFAVAIIVGNTIRLDIEARREEVEVLKLLGASDGFIRRPFLYAALWYGLGGGVIAWLLVQVVVWGLGQPAATLAQLYGSSFVLKAPGALPLLVLMAAGVVMACVGASLTLLYRLRQIEPR